MGTSMTNIWDRPALSIKGDENPFLVYAATGQVLSRWESVEIQVGYVYTALVGSHGNWFSLCDYGSGVTTRSRLQILGEAAKKFFVRKPHQALEGEFYDLNDKVVGFASRRHDIAHGIVRGEGWTNWRIPEEPYQDAQGFFLLPSHYRGQSYDDNYLPLYAFTTRSMQDLQNHLGRLEMEAMGLAARLARHAQASA